VNSVEKFPREDDRADCVISTIEGGPLKGRRFWFSFTDVVRLIDKPEIAPAWPPSPPPGKAWLPEPGYSPSIGDDCRIWVQDVKLAPGIFGAYDRFAFAELCELAASKDGVGIADMLRAGRLTPLLVGTPVHVLGSHTVPISVNDQFIQFPSVSVRVTAGPLFGKKYFVMPLLLARLYEAPRRSPPQERPVLEEKPVLLKSRFATMLRSAENLERAGKTSGALQFYRQIVIEYPGTPEAGKAASRVKALTRK
jgi:hypothetical protein